MQSPCAGRSAAHPPGRWSTVVRLAGGAVYALVLHAGTAAAGQALAAPPASPAAAASQHIQPSPDALLTARRVLATGDAAGLPFAIVDKRAAQLVVFHPDGRLAGASPALLGRDPGDHTVPGVGERTQAGTLRQGDATTPAGRFDSQPGHSLAGDSVVWLDYEAALAIHRVRPGASLANRLQRLATATPADNRVSAGCVVVPAAFFARAVHPLLGVRRAVVYVLPESGEALALPSLGRGGL